MVLSVPTSFEDLHQLVALGELVDFPDDLGTSSSAAHDADHGEDVVVQQVLGQVWTWTANVAENMSVVLLPFSGLYPRQS